MSHKLTKSADIFSVEKFGIRLDVLPHIADVGVVVAETKTGHNQEFIHKTSTFHYFILDGEGTYFLDDEEVPVVKGDLLSIPPGTRIYYKRSYAHTSYYESTVERRRRGRNPRFYLVVTALSCYQTPTPI